MNISPFPHSLSISSPFPLHFLILSSFPRSPAARLQRFVQPWWTLYLFCNPTLTTHLKILSCNLFSKSLLSTYCILLIFFNLNLSFTKVVSYFWKVAQLVRQKVARLLFIAIINHWGQQSFTTLQFSKNRIFIWGRLFKEERKSKRNLCNKWYAHIALV